LWCGGSGWGLEGLDLQPSEHGVALPHARILQRQQANDDDTDEIRASL